MKRNLLCFLLAFGMLGLMSQPTKAKSTKTIVDYYNALKGKLGIDNSYRIIEKDVMNGFLRVTNSISHVDMALWRSSSGKEVVGVFRYVCGGMSGCWGKFNDFKFFDANLLEVRTKVLDWVKLKQMHDKSLPRDLVDADIRTVAIAIPQKGTTIKIKHGFTGGKVRVLATLYYDLNKGTFTIK